MKTIAEQIIENALRTPEKTAITNGRSALTYDELAKAILSARDILRTRYGLKKGDRVVIAADKQLEFAGLYFACHLAGLITLPIAPDTNKTRYEMIKEKVRPALVVGFEDDGLKRAELGEFAAKPPEPAAKAAKPATGAEPAAEAAEAAATAYGDVEYPPLDEVADIMFTTGTTGEPKGVQLTHRNIAAAARNINGFIGNTEDDVEMIALPISHSFGIGRMRCALSNGQTVVMLGSFANVKRFFRFMEEHKVTGFGMVPASWALLKKLSGMKIAEYEKQLRYIEIGSAPMPIEEKKGLIEALPNTRICMHYGLTEASRSAFMEFHECEERLTTVGRQTPGMHIAIRDEKGKDVETGCEGEICVAGDAVTVGYLDLPREESFWGEYFRTGDWGTMDEDGFITLKSRKKELINVGGKKVSPMEVEAELLKLDFITDCACIAAEDPQGVLGEVVKAFVVTSEPERIVKEEIDALIGSSLEGYKHPAEYEIIEEIPKTGNGKVQRLLLK